MRIADWRHPWLAEYPWPFLVEVNRRLCEAKHALHQQTSDGYSQAKTFWEQRHPQVTGIFEAASLCREIHRMAPFCFYNGNTLVAIIRDAIRPVLEKLDAEYAYILRSSIGHYVAGTIHEEEIQAILQSLPNLPAEQAE
ncbi:MAG TPA: hypothetical protein VMN36_03995 [Verrucomicrobiales bacterium]|nr:hypothetical protein [Verrucomicrobiales bacterium]